MTSTNGRFASRARAVPPPGLVAEMKPEDSRLWAMCASCGSEGPRSAFYEKRPNSIPAFRDRCPNCKKDNVDVIDQAAMTLSQRRWQP